jgi:hypothetical protein
MLHELVAGWWLLLLRVVGTAPAADAALAVVAVSVAGPNALAVVSVVVCGVCL